MQPVNLFKLASLQAEWLSVRQAAVAGNIANADTPGYRAVDVEPFEKVLERSGVSLTATNEGHFGSRAQDVNFKTRDDDRTTAILPSDNTVVLETELARSRGTSSSIPPSSRPSTA